MATDWWAKRLVGRPTADDSLWRVVHDAPIPAYVWRRVDDDFELVGVNATATEATGGQVARFLGTRARRAYHACAQIPATMAHCVRSQVSVRQELEYRMLSTGETKHVIASFVPVDDLVIVQVEDLTRLDAADAALRESEARYRLLVECSADPILVITGRTIGFVNRSAIELLGEADATAIVGRAIDEFLVPEDRLRVLAIAAARQRGAAAPTRYECRIRLPGGAVRSVEVSAAPIRYAGESGSLAIVRDMTSRREEEEKLRRAVADLGAARAHAAALSRQLYEVQETERRHLARELHDEFGQQLTTLALLIEQAQRAALSAAPDALAEARRLVGSLMAQVRQLSLDLRPQALDDLGLIPALDSSFGRFTGRTGIEVHWRQMGCRRRFRPEVESAAYRLVQEALTNVARHANTRVVTVRLRASPDRLTIAVADRGVGFDMTLVSMRRRRRDLGSGLIGMRERLALLGGRLTIRAAPGAGVRLRAEVPLDPTEPAHSRRHDDQ